FSSRRRHTRFSRDWSSDVALPISPVRQPVRSGPHIMHPRQILERYGIAPKQSLGQNFLYDEGLLARIVDSAEVSPTDDVLEIGPGLGALTRQLARAARRVVAVELDDRLLPVLRYELEPFANVEIVHGDILTFDPASRFAGPFVVVANVPYYITGAILRRLLEGRPRPRRMVL